MLIKVIHFLVNFEFYIFDKATKLAMVYIKVIGKIILNFKCLVLCLKNDIPAKAPIPPKSSDDKISAFSLILHELCIAFNLSIP